MVAVGVVAGDAAELVAGEFGGLAVVAGDLFARRAGGERPEFQQRAGGYRAVQVPVADDGAVVGAFGAAVVWVQILDQLRAGGAERRGPVLRDAVGVAGVAEDIAERDARGGRARGRAARSPRAS